MLGNAMYATSESFPLARNAHLCVQLTHLSEEQDRGRDEANENCILCEGEFLRGCITQW